MLNLYHKNQLEVSLNSFRIDEVYYYSCFLVVNLFFKVVDNY